MKRNEQMMRTAIHEAGHAIASQVTGLGTKRVTIKPSSDSLGHHESWSSFTAAEQLALESSDRYEEGSTKALRKVINKSMVLLAGGYAEKKYTGRYNHTGAGADVDVYRDLIWRLFSDGEEGKLFDRWIRRRTEIFVEKHWWQIEAVAQALVERITLKGDEVRKVLFDAIEKEGVTRTRPKSSFENT